MTLEVVKMAHEDYIKDPQKSWPSLVPTSSDFTLEKIWSEADQMKQVLAVVVDEEPFLTAYATMINFAKNPYVQVVAVNANHPISAQFGGVAVPAMHVFKRDNQQSPEYSSKEVIKFIDIKNKVNEYINAAANMVHQAPPPVFKDKELSPEPEKDGLVPINYEQFKVQHLDILSALRYMLYQEIPRKPVIKDENLSALKSWIHLLKKYVPGTAPIRRLFYRLDEWTQLQNAIRAEDWISKVNSIQSDLGNPLPSESKWLACKGSKPFLRGYTCGLFFV